MPRVRPQVSREMLPVHCHAWTYLSIVTLECTSPAKRFLPKTVNEKKVLTTQSLAFILIENQYTLLKLTNTIKKLSSTSTTKTKTSKYTHILRYKKLWQIQKTELQVSKNKHKTNEDKNNQIHSQIKIDNEHLENIIKLKNTKN